MDGEFLVVHSDHVSFSRVLDSLEWSVLTLLQMLSRSAVALGSSIPPAFRARSCGISLASMQGVELHHILTERK